eukprot:1092393-Rhodomonas_salina.1
MSPVLTATCVLYQTREEALGCLVEMARLEPRHVLAGTTAPVAHSAALRDVRYWYCLLAYKCTPAVTFHAYNRTSALTLHAQTQI